METIETYVPANWLQDHKGEYVELLEKMVMTIILTKAFERKWSEPLKTPEQFVAFFEAEAEHIHSTPERVRSFFHEAAQIRAKSAIFKQHYEAQLPKGSDGTPYLSRQ